MPLEVEVQRRFLDAVEELHAAALLTGDERLIDRAKGLRRSLTRNRLTIAVVGEFGNGKSTLVNSLVGDAALAMGVAPVTRVTASLHHGPDQRVTLVYKDGVALDVPPEDLAVIGADQTQRLAAVEVYTPSKLLEEAHILDLPGLGDPEGLAAEEIDRVISEADCAICVLNCDRLLSMTERDFLTDRLLPASIDQVCFVLNRADGKSESEITALTERARHILEPISPGARIFSYSALQVLKAQRKKSPGTDVSGDPQAFGDFLANEWISGRRAIRMVSSVKKINALAAAIEDHLRGSLVCAESAAQETEARLSGAQAEIARVEDQINATCSRAESGLNGVRDQFLVGLKDYALKLRENVPREVMEAPVEDARRFLPFYIQDSLKRAVDENDESLKAAVAQVMESLTPDLSRSLAGNHGAVDVSVENGARTLDNTAIAFRVDVEPPAIPLYVSRDRAPLSQGAGFLLGAAATLMFSELYVGLLILAGSFMSREIGKHLEAADRRANLAAGAQTLIHGSIESMELSVTQQFSELSDLVLSTIRETYAPKREESREAAEALDLEKRAEDERRETRAVAAEQGRAHLQAALQFIETLGGDASKPATPRPKRASSRRAREN